MVDYKHIKYKNHLGDFNILVTESCNGKYPTRQTLAADFEIFHAHIWVHNNIVEKLHVLTNKLVLGEKLSDEKIVDLFLHNLNDIKIMKEKDLNKCDEICIWDFDGTLIDTPLPEVGKPIWKEKVGSDWPHVGWWSKVESLSMKIFDQPTIPSVISVFEKLRTDDNIMHVMLTGRRAKKPLEDGVKQILDSHGLKFDRYYHNNGGETAENKMWRMERLLDEFPNIKSIRMWDDRDIHIPRFEEWGDKMISEGRLDKFHITHVLGEHHGETP